jgi:hypothetical protein
VGSVDLWPDTSELDADELPVVHLRAMSFFEIREEILVEGVTFL